MIRMPNIQSLDKGQTYFKRDLSPGHMRYVEKFECRSCGKTAFRWYNVKRLFCPDCRKLSQGERGKAVYEYNRSDKKISERMILLYLAAHPRSTSREIAEHLGVQVNRVSGPLSRLTKFRVLKRDKRDNIRYEYKLNLERVKK